MRTYTLEIHFPPVIMEVKAKSYFSAKKKAKLYWEKNTNQKVVFIKLKSNK